MKIRSFSTEPVTAHEGKRLAVITGLTAVAAGIMAPSGSAQGNEIVPMNQPDAKTTMCDIAVNPKGVLATESLLQAAGHIAVVRNTDGSVYDGSDRLVPSDARLQVADVSVTVCSDNGGTPTFELDDEPR